MVECLQHLAFVERDIRVIPPPPAMTRDRVEAVGLQLFAGAKEAGVIGHVEHPHIFDRPNAAFFSLGAVH